jgi:hypothetical protein
MSLTGGSIGVVRPVGRYCGLEPETQLVIVV